MRAQTRLAPGWRGLATIPLLLALAGAVHAASPRQADSADDVVSGTVSPGPAVSAVPDPMNTAPPSSPRGLLVAPTRVVLGGSHRSEQLTLVNTGNRTATYRISFVHMRMTESGDMHPVDSALEGELFADTLVRFSPRRVVLPPGVPQTVRVQLRLPADLPAGEYRSHLLFREVPDMDTTPAAALPTHEVKMQLTPVFGVSVPVILRHGETSARVSISAARVRPAGAGAADPVLEMALERTGNQSVYGDIRVSLIEHGIPRTVGEAHGLAVYSPNARRVVAIPLHLPPRTSPGESRLLATYTVNGGADAPAAAKVELALP